MADFQQMYKILFNAVTDCIKILQEVQLQTEELYISYESDTKTAVGEKNDG